MINEGDTVWLGIAGEGIAGYLFKGFIAYVDF